MKNVISFRKSRFAFLLTVVLIAAMALSLTACGGEKAPADTGEKSFTFEVYDLEGLVESYEFTSDAQYVGEVLVAEGLIEGEEGPYGLYVKTVRGITYDYDADGVYWSFYVDGEYGMSGVDTTEIADGTVYSFRAEKG